MNESDALDQIRLYLPKYLSPERQQALWNELKAFPADYRLYSERNEEAGLLQGDGWRGFIAIDFVSRGDRIVSGLVMSNSCDISAENRRALTPNVVFAPLLSLGRYKALLESSGETAEQISSTMTEIRKQKITSLMYFPGVAGSDLAESLVLFDNLHAQPLDNFLGRERSRLFRLSDFGFYLFLFKLSIHFTRMQEGIER